MCIRDRLMSECLKSDTFREIVTREVYTTEATASHPVSYTHLLFPEGTRSRKGNQLQEFKSGSFKIAVKATCPIVPVALKNCFVPFDSNTIAAIASLMVSPFKERSQ